MPLLRHIVIGAMLGLLAWIRWSDAKGALLDSYLLLHDAADARTCRSVGVLEMSSTAPRAGDARAARNARAASRRIPAVT